MAQVEHTPRLGKVMELSVENYKWAKDLVANNKTLGPRVSPIIDYSEKTTLSLLEKSPVQVEDVITGIDTRVDKVVTYGADTLTSIRGAPKKVTDRTLKSVHEKLSLLKIEEDGEVVESPGVSTIASDAKVITTERLSKLLDASEGYIAQYLPISEEDRKELKVESKGEFKPLAFRAGRQGKVAAVRLQEQAMAKISGLKKRSQDVVHVDLVKYSEFLDTQKDRVKQTIYVTFDKIDANVIQPTKDTAQKATDTVKNRVINPAREKVLSIELPFQDRVVHVWTVVEDEYNSRVVQPRDQIVQMFREELALQQDLAKQKSGEDLTITAGLKAVIAAASLRLSKEWEVRVSPTISKVLGRKTNTNEVDHDEEAKHFDDEDTEAIKALAVDEEEEEEEDDDDSSSD